MKYMKALVVINLVCAAIQIGLGNGMMTALCLVSALFCHISARREK
tara:strand:+ start:753 stop:890 length:138 start_codon:yes stop_codon:yes gene_type:complete